MDVLFRDRTDEVDVAGRDAEPRGIGPERADAGPREMLCSDGRDALYHSPVAVLCVLDELVYVRHVVQDFFL